MTEPSRDEQHRLGIGDKIADPTDAEIVRFEEEARVRPSGWRGAGYLRARKRVERVRVQEEVERTGEDVDIERIAVIGDDPGGVLNLPDGGISIPVYEEELVISKRVVLKERIVIRKRVTTAAARVDAELQRERVEIEIDDDVADRVRLPDENTTRERTRNE